MQKLLIKILFSQKEKMLALFLERLSKEFKANRSMIANQVLKYLPINWTQNATPEEMENLLQVLKDSIENLYQAVKPLTQK